MSRGQHTHNRVEQLRREATGSSVETATLYSDLRVYIMDVAMSLATIHGISALRLSYKTMHYLTFAWLIGLDTHKASSWLAHNQKKFLDML